jgi:hypothetical protein
MKIAGIKKTYVITASQFQKLGRFPELTRPDFIKAHYDIVFKEVIRKNDSNYMNCEEFFNAIELVVMRLNNSPPNFENLIEYIDTANRVLSK